MYQVRIEYQFHIVPLSISNHFVHFKISAISPFNYEGKNKKLSINLYQIAINRPHNYFEYEYNKSFITPSQQYCTCICMGTF